MGVVTSRLPKYAGQHDVGSYDIEVVLERPRTFGSAYLVAGDEVTSHAANGTTTTLKDGRKLRPALTMESVLFTLFYPCEGAASSSRRVTRPHWIERPVSRTARGWLRFANARANVSPKRLHTYILLAFAWLFGSRIAIPAVQSGKLKKADKSKLPLVIFSHGLAGNRKVYSQYCGELASRGYVVAAIEHRDGTAPSTTILGRDGKERSVKEYTPAAEFLWKDGTQLTQNQVRAQQLLMRVAEVETTLETLGVLSSGEAISNVRSAFQPTFDSRAWQNTLDTGKEVIMAGHSFGSATTISCLRTPGTQKAFSKGICLDPWVDPLGEGLLEADPCAQEDADARAASPAVNGSNSNENRDIRVPLLVQNSETFTRWQDHFVKVRQLVQEVKAPRPSYLITIGGTIHSSFSDFHLLLPSWLTRWQNRKASADTKKDAKRDMDNIVNASVEFLDDMPRNILKQQVAEHEGSIPAGQIVMNCRTEQV